MIEKKFIENKKRDLKIQEFLASELNNVGLSKIDMHINPIGVKLTIHSAMSGLVVGRKGANIRLLQEKLIKEFKFDNLQIEIKDVPDPILDAQVVAEQVANQLIRQGKTRFKAIGHRTLQAIINAGARGAEILISGKVPGKRSKTWRFYRGYLPKCGNVSDTQIDKGFKVALLRPGVVGITVQILHSHVKMPDDVTVPTREEETEIKEEVKKELQKETVKKEEKPKTEPKKEKEVKKEKTVEKKKVKEAKK